MSNNDGYYGTQQSSDATGEYNSIAFVIRSILNGRNFAALVKVVAVTAPGGLALAGTVDVQPLVNQLDGQGNAIPHGVVNALPYIRIQGGANGVIMDPVMGDIGLCIFCDRDGTSVQATRGAANPGSLRRSDMADGVYIGGILNGIPTQYLMFTTAGIELHSPTKINLTAPEIDLVAPVVVITASTSTTITTPTFTVNGNAVINGGTQFNGNAAGTGSITAPTIAGTNDVTGGGKSLKTHTHSGVTAGAGTSGPPV